jgi:hypothetical protein
MIHNFRPRTDDFFDGLILVSPPIKQWFEVERGHSFRIVTRHTIFNIDGGLQVFRVLGFSMQAARAMANFASIVF